MFQNWYQPRQVCGRALNERCSARCRKEPWLDQKSKWGRFCRHLRRWHPLSRVECRPHRRFRVHFYLHYRKCSLLRQVFLGTRLSRYRSIRRVFQAISLSLDTPSMAWLLAFSQYAMPACQSSPPRSSVLSGFFSASFSTLVPMNIPYDLPFGTTQDLG